MEERRIETSFTVGRGVMENGQTEIFWEHLQLWERGELKSRQKGPILLSQADAWARQGPVGQGAVAKGWKALLRHTSRIGKI
jgi:hypothetical protein